MSRVDRERRRGDEAHPARRQLRLQFPVVIQLAVVHQRQAMLGERLVGRGGQVDDREPPVAKLHRHTAVLVTPGPSRVRPAVRDPFAHDVHELLAVGLLVAPGDPAHFSHWPFRESCCR